MILVTPCADTFSIFFRALQENPNNKQVFDSYFRVWTDIQSIVRSCQESCGQSKSLTAAEYNPARIEKLWQHVTYPRIVKSSDSLQTMKFILDEVLPRKNPESRDFNPDHLLTFTSPCILQPKK